MYVCIYISTCIFTLIWNTLVLIKPLVCMAGYMHIYICMYIHIYVYIYTLLTYLSVNKALGLHTTAHKVERICRRLHTCTRQKKPYMFEKRPIKEPYVYTKRYRYIHIHAYICIIGRADMPTTAHMHMAIRTIHVREETHQRALCIYKKI